MNIFKRKKKEIGRTISANNAAVIDPRTQIQGEAMQKFLRESASRDIPSLAISYVNVGHGAVAIFDANVCDPLLIELWESVFKPYIDQIIEAKRNA